MIILLLSSLLLTSGSMVCRTLTPSSLTGTSAWFQSSERQRSDAPFSCLWSVVTHCPWHQWLRCPITSAKGGAWFSASLMYPTQHRLEEQSTLREWRYMYTYMCREVMVASQTCQICWSVLTVVVMSFRGNYNDCFIPMVCIVPTNWLVWSMNGFIITTCISTSVVLMTVKYTTVYMLLSRYGSLIPGLLPWSFLLKTWRDMAWEQGSYMVTLCSKFT